MGTARAERPVPGPYRTVHFAVDGRIGSLTLDRPDRLNALNPAMLDELLDLLASLKRNEDLNALFITGNGRLFSSGVDLSTSLFMESVQDDSVFAGKRLLDWQHLLIEELYELPMLTVAAVNGDAVGGGGFGTAMACDMRIAVRGARFWMIPSMLDVVQDYGLTWLVQKQVGSSRALYMAVLGQPVTAEQALAWGLVNEVVEDQDRLQERVQALAAQIDGMGPDALRMLKHVVRNGESSPLPQQLRLEAIANGLTFQSREFAERKAAYLGGLHRGPR